MNDPDGPSRRCACGKLFTAGEWDAHIQASARCRKADHADYKQAIRDLKAIQAFREGLPFDRLPNTHDGFRKFNGLHANYRPPRKARARGRQP